MFWVNGERSDTIALNDRSFHYGDGGFTTILTAHGNIQHWALHQARMEACLQALAIPFPDWTQVYTWLQTACLPDALAGLKLHISRGSGGRGYSPAGLDQPTITISHFAYPAHYMALRTQGVALGICEQRLGLNPLLAGHKHNNRLEQVLLKAEMDRAGYLDGVVLDIDDHLVETTMANLFWVHNCTLYTPQLDRAGVAGVARQQVLQWASCHDLPVMMGKMSLTALQQADEVFITNSILGVAPVIQIAELHYPIGAITRRIQEIFPSC